MCGRLSIKTVTGVKCMMDSDRGGGWRNWKDWKRLRVKGQEQRVKEALCLLQPWTLPWGCAQAGRKSKVDRRARGSGQLPRLTQSCVTEDAPADHSLFHLKGCITYHFVKRPSSNSYTIHTHIITTGSRKSRSWNNNYKQKTKGENTWGASVCVCACEEFMFHFGCVSLLVHSCTHVFCNSPLL